MNPFTTIHERATAFDDLAPHDRGMVDLVPVPAPAPPVEHLTIASSAYVARAVADWVIALTSHSGLVEPEQVSIHPTRAHLWFRDATALATLLAWAEQLDAEHRLEVRVDHFPDSFHAVLVTGRVVGVEVLLHVVTRTGLPDRALDLADLRRYVDGDRATRAVGDVPAVLPEGAPVQQPAAEQ